jgi:hypothetical protein
MKSEKSNPIEESQFMRETRAVGELHLGGVIDDAESMRLASVVRDKEYVRRYGATPDELLARVKAGDAEALSCLERP